MGIADPEAALEKLHEFRALLDAGKEDAINRVMPLVESIAKQIDRENVSDLAGVHSP